MSDSDLTPRQTEILRLIQRTVQDTGMPPTRKEIADELGFKSANAAEEHLRTLARKGVITLQRSGGGRGTDLCDDIRRSKLDFLVEAHGETELHQQVQRQGQARGQRSNQQQLAPQRQVIETHGTRVREVADGAGASKSRRFGTPVSTTWQ